MNKETEFIGKKVDKWYNNLKKPYLEFDSDDEIWRISYTPDNRLIIEQVGWILDREELLKEEE